MGTFNRSLLALAVLLLASCTPGGLGVSSEEECIATFAVPAGTRMAVNHAYQQCRVLFDPESSPAAKEWAVCILPKLAETKSEQGARAAARICHQAG